MTDHRLRQIERELFAARPTADLVLPPDRVTLALAWLREHARAGSWPTTFRDAAGFEHVPLMWQLRTSTNGHAGPTGERAGGVLLHPWPRWHRRAQRGAWDHEDPPVWLGEWWWPRARGHGYEEWVVEPEGDTTEPGAYKARVVGTRLVERYACYPVTLYGVPRWSNLLRWTWKVDGLLSWLEEHALAVRLPEPGSAQQLRAGSAKRRTVCAQAATSSAAYAAMAKMGGG